MDCMSSYFTPTLQCSCRKLQFDSKISAAQVGPVVIPSFYVKVIKSSAFLLIYLTCCPQTAVEGHFSAHLGRRLCLHPAEMRWKMKTLFSLRCLQKSVQPHLRSHVVINQLLTHPSVLACWMRPRLPVWWNSPECVWVLLCDWWGQPADLLESENTGIKG